MQEARHRTLGEELRRDLLGLAQAQVVGQVTAATSIDTQAIGVMGFDVAVAAIVVTVQGGAYLWVFALWSLAISAAFAVQTLLFAPDPHVGPSVAETLEASADFTDQELQDAVLAGVADATAENTGRLQAKGEPVGAALRYLSLAIILAVLGQI